MVPPTNSLLSATESRTSSSQKTKLSLERLQHERDELHDKWYKEWKTEHAALMKAERTSWLTDVFDACANAVIWFSILTVATFNAGRLLDAVLPTNATFKLKDDGCDDWDWREARWN
eukprot:Protomagalhaensia_sp_Gyna_25__2700@NODE_2545_length_1023_cov_113_794715_g2111_i0_p2_GENE_NODE_2545_length_1023_cov_113_794715_g2111_i0NODE_2545_length_1023_cov_113_794715_g2111_i0_p2_ORF_typecomplete_len117_score17_80BshC/PF10079_9/0_11_NODE_2545_length_1023_cov_113_794715_g2111_i0596946